jgi:hypothetical protein
MMVQTYNPRLRQEDCEFEASLGHCVSKHNKTSLYYNTYSIDSYQSSAFPITL